MKFGRQLVTVPQADLLGRLHPMGEAIRPTGITYEDAMDAAQRGGGIDFEGRKARVVHLSQKSGTDTPHSARIELHLGDRYLALLGYFSRDGEFMEEGREHPFGKAT
jgi:hypothetical protein